MKNLSISYIYAFLLNFLIYFLSRLVSFERPEYVTIGVAIIYAIIQIYMFKRVDEDYYVASSAIVKGSLIPSFICIFMFSIIGSMVTSLFIPLIGWIYGGVILGSSAVVMWLYLLPSAINMICYTIKRDDMTLVKLFFIFSQFILCWDVILTYIVAIHKKQWKSIGFGLLLGIVCLVVNHII